MSITYVSKCDGCGLIVNEWPEGRQFHGWAMISFADCDKFNSPQRLDYCPECWATMFVTLIKEHR